MSKAQSFKLFGIFGYPLGHTLSPAMQEAAFGHLGEKVFYLVLEQKPRDFHRTMKRLKSCLLEGFNITVPYKEAVIRYLDRLTPEAAAIGAVNTVFRRQGQWIGANTDGAGFITSLREDAGFNAAGKRALILGAGGSARAVAFALAKGRAREIVIANRTPARSQKIIRDFRRRFPSAEWKSMDLSAAAMEPVLRGADLIVNATSVGLKPSDRSLIPASRMPRSGNRRKLFVDLIYRPAQTDFLKQAHLKGHRVLNGAGMLAAQGARSFEYWTGKKAPLALMRRVLDAALKERAKGKA